MIDRRNETPSFSATPPNPVFQEKHGTMPRNMGLYTTGEKKPLKKLAEIQFEPIMNDRIIMKWEPSFFFFQREGECDWGRGVSSVLKVQLEKLHLTLLDTT